MDWADSYRRNFEEGFSDRDPRTLRILDAHALLERELDRYLYAALAHPARLKNLGFGHKVSIWAALINLDNHVIDPLVKLLIGFNDLRNGVAHGDSEQKTDRLIAKIVRILPPAANDYETFEGALAFLLGCLSVTTEEHLPVAKQT